MLEAEFIKQNAEIWKDLEGAITKEVGSFAQVDQLTSLYRAVSGHLNYARHHYGAGSLCDYLGELTTKTHTIIYKGRSPKRRARFFRRVLPTSLYENVRAMGLSAAIFFCAMLFSFVIGISAPQYLDAFLPEAYRGITEEDLRTNASDLEGETGSAVLSNFIMVNNMYVTALSFALGITCGVGTVYVLVTNGFILGALASLFVGYGKFLFFLSLIVPHEIWELTAIVIAGGAGLRIGYSLLRPGAYRRRDALVKAARSALGQMGLVMLLLIVAAMIEGFFTPLPIRPELKLLFTLLSAVPLIWYFARVPALKRAALLPTDSDALTG